MSKKKGKGADQDASRLNVTGPSPTEEALCSTFDDYQCTGNIQVDFPKLCALLDFKNIPRVLCKTLEKESEEPPAMRPSWKNIVTSVMKNEPRTTPKWSKPHLHVELENKNPLSTKNLKIMGWKVHNKIFQVLNKILPHLSRLESLYFWQAGVTDEMVMTLSNTVSLGCSLRYVFLDGNPLPNDSYHLLLSEDSVITRLFLRNNGIGDEGARLIGSALSTAKTSNKNLQFLSLAFNHIGDTGAAYLAQGLRLNRVLLYVSLAGNQIGDSGAAQFAKVLGQFPLTHEEVVQRRMLLVEKMVLNIRVDTDQPDKEQDGRSSLGKAEAKIPTKKKQEMAKKDEKPEKGGAKKKGEEGRKKGAQKNPKVAPDKVPPAKGGKAVGKKKPAPADAPEEKAFVEVVEAKVDLVNPLLDPLVQCRDGQVFLPGNSTLMFLSLAGNAITEKSLPLFLTSLKQQTEGGLLRLSLSKNRFPENCDLNRKIIQLLELRNPFNKPETKAVTDKEPQ